MKPVVVYLCIILASLFTLFVLYIQSMLDPWVYNYKLYFFSLLMGGIGGCIYCLRGVYINACVKKNWDKEWIPWYYIRPIVSTICGFISAIFLKAGLLVLGTGGEEITSEIGFYALAFISGYNVDKFLGKIEDIAQATWGIERSRSSKEKQEQPTQKKDSNGEDIING